MDELMTQFCVESKELVQQATDDLLAMEAVPADRARLESAFRAIHTLKGSVALFDFGSMLTVLHRAEDLLSQARSGDVDVDVALIDPLLAVIDWIDGSIDSIAAAGRLSDAQNEQAARLLVQLKLEANNSPPIAFAGTVDAIPGWASALSAQIGHLGFEGPLVAIRYEPHPECFFNGDDPLATMAKVSDLKHLQLSFRDPPPAIADYDPFRCALIIEAIAGNPLPEIEAIFRLLPDQVRMVALQGIGGQGTPGVPDQPAERSIERVAANIRVDTSRIDTLIEIAGELIIAKNGLLPLARDARSGGDLALSRRIGASHDDIERLVGSLYTAVTRVRMVPLEHTFRRLPRFVRETSARLGKSIDLNVEGEGVEADREIVENLFDPLLHLVRNALDHGIEPEEERLRAQKPPRGQITLRASVQGDQIQVVLSDDGRGMDPSRVRDVARAKGLLSDIDATALSDDEILQMVFSPGFSTASSVSDLSGRGVGLDVVQSSIRQLGGKVELQSSLGSGTSFTMRLPIAFSMSQLMVVEVGAERYGIPLEHILETQKIPSQIVQAIREGHAFSLRDQTVPLVYLAELLNLPRQPQRKDFLKALIVRAGTEKIAVVVDEISDRAETLARPLTGLLQGVPGISGTTVLGDGKVLLVLNLEDLIQ
jgi:two-component system chemotaxis sensor kinase CheA